VFVHAAPLTRDSGPYPRPPGEVALVSDEEADAEGGSERRGVRTVARCRAGQDGPVSLWGVTPRQSVEAECARRGTPAVVKGCVAFLEGRGSDERLLVALGGPHADAVLGGAEGGPGGYWPRVWGARGLLYAWEDSAARSVVHATTDDAWRVREMALKVIARHRLDEAAEAASGAMEDPVPRVRRAAERALVRLTSESR